MTPAIQANFTKKENRKSVLDHFEKTGIDRLEALMQQVRLRFNSCSPAIA